MYTQNVYSGIFLIRTPWNEDTFIYRTHSSVPVCAHNNHWNQNTSLIRILSSIPRVSGLERSNKIRVSDVHCRRVLLTLGEEAEKLVEQLDWKSLPSLCGLPGLRGNYIHDTHIKHVEGKTLKVVCQSQRTGFKPVVSSVQGWHSAHQATNASL